MIHAKSGDKKFLDRIADEAFYGVVHSTFNRTFNIRCLESGELYTVACRDLDDGPSTIIADFADLRNCFIPVNETVFGKSHQLRIGNQLTINTKSAWRWICVLPDYPKNASQVRENLQLAIRYLNEFGRGGGMYPSQQKTSSFDKETARMLRERTDALLCEMARGNMQEIIEAAKRILGLGPGLTPSGDDFLIGLFSIINLKGNPLSAYNELLNQILNHAQMLTNDISFAALQHAAKGQVRESIVKLINSLLNGNRESIKGHLSEVILIGSTSGTDIAMGIISGLQLCCQKE